LTQCGGADEIQCLYDVTAPSSDGPYVITVRGTVEDPASGDTAFGDDLVNIVVVGEE